MNENKIVELFGVSAVDENADWNKIAEEQHCPYLERKCLKNRKSQPDIAIGTCLVKYGVRNPKNILICPHRLLSRGQIFMDCLHLLRLHEPGNQLHKIAQVEIPGGNVDYFLVSVRNSKVVDFVGIELQTLDTTGTVWPARQQFLESAGVSVVSSSFASRKSFGMNWKMTAKTILVQLHHKIETFEGLGKHLALVMQDVLLEYMMNEFNFGHMESAKLGHSLHFHSYALKPNVNNELQLNLASRISTDAEGMARALGLQASSKVELNVMMAKLENKISSQTLLGI